MADRKGPKFGEWTPVGEAMPELSENGWGDPYVLVTNGKNVTIGQWTCNHFAKLERNRQPRWESHGRLLNFKVTHWMPYPPPPEPQS